MQGQIKKFPNLGAFSTSYIGKEILFWDDERSLKRLSRTSSNKAFFDLTQFYEPQSDKFLCGAATIAIVLNAIFKDSLSIKHLVDPDLEALPRKLGAQFPENYLCSFARFTQRNLFSHIPEIGFDLQHLYGIHPRNGKVRHGLQLTEIGAVLKAYQIPTTIVEVVDPYCENHVLDISHALSTPGHYLIANFDRSIWGIEGGGHVCPIAAYDPISNSALLIDVNPCGKWVWIDIHLLLRSMATADEGRNRGYILVTKP